MSLIKRHRTPRLRVGVQDTHGRRDLLTHVHIAGLKQRIIPGVHPEADNYVDGFKGLKLIGYQGAVSFEGGWPKNPTNPKKGLPEQERIRLMRNMVKMLEAQWEMA